MSLELPNSDAGPQYVQEILKYLSSNRKLRRHLPRSKKSNAPDAWHLLDGNSRPKVNNGYVIPVSDDKNLYATKTRGRSTLNYIAVLNKRFDFPEFRVVRLRAGRAVNP